MSKLKELQDRSGTVCELCTAAENLSVYDIPESPNVGLDSSILICETCKGQIEDPSTTDPNHWRCLNDSMWSQIPGVQVMAWRMLTRLRPEGWPQDLLDMLYLEEDVLVWAKATGEGDDESTTIKHMDSNGATLQAGDNVVLIKDLNVKGANFTAKRGTAVRNISLVHDNPEHIEGKVSGQHIVILTKFVKKS
ncbi:alkylphosphonate utilization protein [uncultured Aquimarina sp.]|uniref:PhnA domain-containing protein n=1 Tax=uncultured Aquimarina sp. TaxID=575652 RepID=UPI00260CDE43|nr:alkylphosphonate utilization protein [uncultured Aquimarina sp.]